MQDKRLFLKWALFVSLVAIGAVIGARLGLTEIVFADPTRLTLGPLAILAFGTAWSGLLSWRLSNGGDPLAVKHSLRSTWFLSSVCVSLGLLGTAIGYFMMMRGKGSAEQLVAQVKLGMGTAFMNTIVGGFAGLLIEVQSHIVGQAVAKALRRKREEKRLAKKKRVAS